MSNKISLEARYKSVCNDYIKAFCEKQGMLFDFWVADIVGGIAFIGDYSFNFQDIVWDVNSKQPKGLILDWFNENIETPFESINYYAYSKRKHHEQ